MTLQRRSTRWTMTVTATLATLIFSVVAPAHAEAGQAATAATHVTALESGSATGLKLMNYYPADASWSNMWLHYSHARTDADFAAIAGLGANAVRLIVQPSAVGWPSVTATGAAALQDAIVTAAAHGLSVELTLFDLWYSWNDLADSTAWVTQLLSPYTGDHRLARVELQNEMPVNATTVKWAMVMLPLLQELLPGTPRSMSEYDLASLQSLTDQIPDSDIDVIDIHLSGSLEKMPAELATTRAIARGRPVVVGEAGAPTDGGTKGADQAQLTFYQSVAQLVADNGIPTFAPWILSDLDSAGTPDINSLRDPVMLAYGLRRLDGTWKPAAAVVRDMFDGASTLAFSRTSLAAKKISSDGTFQNEDTVPSATGRLGAWRTFDASQAKTVGVAVASTGNASAVLSLTTGDNRAVPSVMQSFLLLSGRRSVYARVAVKLVNATGETNIAIAWFAGTQYLGGVESKTADTTIKKWQTIAVRGLAPVNATAFQIHLKSKDNTGTAYFDSVALR